MEKYNLKIDGNNYEVEINVESNIADVSVNGKSYKVEIQRNEEATSGKIVRPVSSKSSASKQAAQQPPKPAANDTAGMITSPLPGNIIDVLVAEGEHVKKGDVIVVIEAMKMENNIMAGNDGVVKSVFVKPGKTVMLGDPLVSIEEVKIIN